MEDGQEEELLLLRQREDMDVVQLESTGEVGLNSRQCDACRIRLGIGLRLRLYQYHLSLRNSIRQSLRGLQNGTNRRQRQKQRLRRWTATRIRDSYQ